jgi:hypothetical protein
LSHKSTPRHIEIEKVSDHIEAVQCSVNWLKCTIHRAMIINLKEFMPSSRDGDETFPDKMSKMNKHNDFDKAADQNWRSIQVDGARI